MTVQERREAARVRDAKFRRPLYRCRYCPTVVDANTRASHLGRCTGFAAAGTVARSTPIEEHFTAEAKP